MPPEKVELKAGWVSLVPARHSEKTHNQSRERCHQPEDAHPNKHGKRKAAVVNKETKNLTKNGGNPAQRHSPKPRSTAQPVGG